MLIKTLQHKDIISIILLIYIIIIGNLYAQPNTAHQLKIKTINNKIIELQQVLQSTTNKRNVLTNELASTAKTINNCIQQIHLMENNNKITQNKINELNIQTKKLQHDLAQQQQAFAQNLRLHYMMQQEKSCNQTLVLHEYIIHAQQKIINSIIDTKVRVTSNNLQLKLALEKQQNIYQKLQVQQKILNKTKQYDSNIIGILNQNIHSHEQELLQYHNNKNHLINLLHTIHNNTTTTPINNHKMQFMHHKLSPPVTVARNFIKNINHGLIFRAPEGTPVHALYSGRIVFSDWLNGYGLLLIIDHGHGFMTLYAHNQSFTKKRGSVITTGEQIATVGHSGGLKENGLYFEIRHNGKLISPFKWFI